MKVVQVKAPDGSSISVETLPWHTPEQIVNAARNDYYGTGFLDKVRDYAVGMGEAIKGGYYSTVSGGSQLIGSAIEAMDSMSDQQRAMLGMGMSYGAGARGVPYIPSEVVDQVRDLSTERKSSEEEMNVLAEAFIEVGQDNRQKRDEMIQRSRVNPETRDDFAFQVASSIFASMPLMVATYGMSGFAQMADEAINDAEQTLGMSFLDMDRETQKSVSMAVGLNSLIGGSFEKFGATKLGLTPRAIKDFMSGKGKLPAGQLRRILSDAITEGGTELSQGQVRDTVARVFYDDDRDLLSWDVAKERGYEFALGAAAGGVMSTGRALLSGMYTNEDDLLEDYDPGTNEEGQQLQVFNAIYTYENGDTEKYDIEAESKEAVVKLISDARKDEEGFDPGRIEFVKREEEAEQRQDDLGDVRPFEEEFEPVFNDEGVQTGWRSKEPVFAPTSDKTGRALGEEDLAQPSRGEARSDFVLPPQMSKMKPGYQQTQNINWASDLHRAIYGAKRADSKARKLLRDYGYSDQQIVQMRKAIIEQMKSQYSGKDSEVTVDLDLSQIAKPVGTKAQPVGATAGNRLFNNPLEDASVVANNYGLRSGIPFSSPKPINKLDTDRARRIAKAFDEMQENPNDPEVQSAYQAMVRETVDQYNTIASQGYKVEVNNNEPYSSSAEMIEDLRNRKTMKIFSTESGFGDVEITDQQRAENPLLQRTGITDVNGVELLANDVFRFVHDFFGHAKMGNGFGPVGEENAWRVHSVMYTPLARRAMTTETRGQNSWVNFSGVNNEAFALRDKARQLRKEGKTEEANELVNKVYEMMSFADQKVGLLPEEFSRTDEELAQPVGAAPVVTPRDAAWDEKVKSNLSNSRFRTEKEFNTFIKNREWGILTAENPNVSQASDQENAYRMERAKNWLSSRGYLFDEVFGKYGESENSLFVSDLSVDDAIEFAKEFNQESVATSKGLVYADGSYQKRETRRDNFGGQYDNLYSTANIDGTQYNFALGYENQVTGNAYEDGIASGDTRSAVEPEYQELESVDEVIRSTDDRIYNFPSADERKQNAVPTSSLEGGKVRTIAKSNLIKKSEAVEYPDGKTSENKYNSLVSRGVERMRNLLDLAKIRFPNFMGWYVERIDMSMRIMEDLDPTLQNPDNNFVMKLLLAVTSDGNKVNENFDYAYETYLHWVNARDFNWSGKFGKNDSNIRNKLKLINDRLIKPYGLKRVQQFLDGESTVANQRRILIDEFGFSKKEADDATKGELADEVVPHALILGPKLGSFYNNLQGRLNTITMDRWFMRTFGRLMGTQLKRVSKAQINTKKLKYKKAAKAAMRSLSYDKLVKLEKKLESQLSKAKTAEQRSDISGELKMIRNFRNEGLYKLSPEPNNYQIKLLSKFFSKAENRHMMKQGQRNSGSPLDNLRLASNALSKVADGYEIVESPTGGIRRRFIRRVIYKSIDGLGIDPANFQALLWYYEKDIHDSFGSLQTDKAPDYGTAANNVYRKKTGRDSQYFRESDLIGDVSAVSRGRSGPVSQPVGTRPADDGRERGSVVPDGGRADGSKIPPYLSSLVEKTSGSLGKIGASIKTGKTNGRNPALYDPNTGQITIDPDLTSEMDDTQIDAVVREEVIHAAMHKVAMEQNPKMTRAQAWNKVMDQLGKALDPSQRRAIERIYGAPLSDINAGAEYWRAAIQQLMYGEVTEQLLSGEAANIVYKFVKRIQSYVARVLGKDIKDNEFAARIVVDTVDLLQRMDPDTRPVNQKAVQEARDTLMGRNEEGVGIDDIVPVPIGTQIEGGRDPKAVPLQKAFFTLRHLFQRIHPRLVGPLNNWANRRKRKVGDYQGRVRKFGKALHKLRNTPQGRRLAQVLSYSPSNPDEITEQDKAIFAERDRLLRKTGLLAEYQINVRPLLDKLYRDARAVGIEVDYVYGYFPRLISDFAGLKKSMKKEELREFNKLLEEENQKRRDSGKKEINSGSIEASNLFHDWLMGSKYNKNRESAPGFTRQRDYNMIPADKLKYYASPAEALMFRIKETTEEIENTRTFGRIKDNGMREQGVGEFNTLLAELVSNGEITAEGLDLLRGGTGESGLVGVLLKKNQAEWTVLQATRTLAYFQLINPTSVLSQVYDLALTFTKNPGTTLRAMFDTVSGVDVNELKRMGINPVSDQYFYGENVNKLNRNLSKSLEVGLTSVGFAKMDAFMKKVNVRSEYLSAIKEAENLRRNPDSYRAKKFKKLLQDQMYTRWEQTYADLLSKKRRSPYVRDFMLSELRKTQPLTELEKTYLEQSNPQLRSLYTLKRFMVTQLSFIKENGIDKIAEGNSREKAEGVAFMLRLASFLLLVGVPVDALKDWITGRAGYMDDYVFNSILRVAGISKYNLYQIKTRGVAHALADAYLVPVSFQQGIDVFGQTQAILLAEDTQERYEQMRKAKILNSMPFDDFWYYRWGYGAEAQERKRKLRFREDGVLPTIEPSARR